MKNHQKYFTVKALNTFLENVFEVAYGDNAISKYTMIDVVEKLREFSDNALKFEQLQEIFEDGKNNKV